MVLTGYILLAALLLAWTAQAILSALQARKLLRRLTRGRREAHDRHRPRAIVIMPFKGVEPRLDAALDRLFTQDYPDYRLLLVVESERDPAHGPLQQAIARHPGRRAELLVAGTAGPRQGQKVHNQLHALDHLAPQLTHDVLVFADSDAVPDEHWLGELVGPLAQPRTGVTTGYRWLVPERGGIWSNLASVINASVACMLCSREKHGHAWGGSMAMHADFAMAHNLRGRLTGALTDDYPVSAMCRAAGKRVYFVARCLVPTPVDFSLATLINFAHRQYLITRVYAPRLFAGALLVTWLYLLGMTGAWAAVALWLMGVASPVAATIASAALVTVGIANQCRAGYRAAAVNAAFDDATVAGLRTALQWDRWATPLWMTLHALLVLRAAFGRTMTWRGIRYILHGPQDVVREQDAANPG
jgi:ceramide glucosyltransferase